VTPEARTAVRAGWAVGALGIVACLVAGGIVVMLSAPTSFLLIDGVGIVLAGLGALVISRQPGNSIGWLMCLTALGASLVHLPAGYAYVALVGGGAPLPFGGMAAWLSAWSWVPVLAFLPLIAVRFPEGRVQRRWRAVDWVSIGGTALFAIGIALGTQATLAGFMPIPGPIAVREEPSIAVPFGATISGWLLVAIQGSGLTLIVIGFVSAAAAVVARFRTAEGDERLQLKWFAYAGAIVAAAFLYGAVAWNFFGQPLYLALTPLEVATLGIPLAVAIAILRYRLYDIDLIINRSLVYVSLTAILTALYTAVITLLQRVFISASGQPSNATYVLTAFVVVVAFSPIKDWLQRQVDRRVPRTTPSAVLERFRSQVDAVVLALDVRQVAFRLVDRAVLAFDAVGAELYLDSSPGPGPVYRRGGGEGDRGLVVALMNDRRPVGRLVMANRRGSMTYSDRDRRELESSADLVAHVLVLAATRDRPIGPQERIASTDHERR